MKQSDSIANLATALVAAQRDIKTVKKDSTNPDYRSRYASLDAIIDHVRPHLVKHGLAIVQGASTPHTDEAGHVAAFSVDTMLLHTSGEWVSNSAIVPVVGRMVKGGGFGDVTPQAAGSAMTYGRRYGLSALLAIASDDDDDGALASTTSADDAVATIGRASGGRSAAAFEAAKRMPFGKHKGTPLGDIATSELESTVDWCSTDDSKREKFKDLIDACRTVIRSRGADTASPDEAEDLLASIH
jgi:hypothetical protein